MGGRLDKRGDGKPEHDGGDDDCAECAPMLTGEMRDRQIRITFVSLLLQVTKRNNCGSICGMRLITVLTLINLHRRHKVEHDQGIT